jgi:polyisoprenoid-binding protein YceI
MPLSQFLTPLGLALLGLHGGALQAQTVVPAQSEIVFVSKQMGVPVEGRFTRWQAKVNLDPRHPETGEVAFSIDTASASFPAAEVEAEVRRPAWFDSARFPQASFQSIAIRPLGGERFEVRGRLTIKGSSREVVAPVTLVRSGTQALASGSLTINRQDFRIGDGEWNDPTLVAGEVVVRYRITLAGLPAQ